MAKNAVFARSRQPHSPGWGGIAMNQSKTKKALMMSILSIVLCVALLSGMTFAWFTDNDSTDVSAIQTGTLTVELQKKTGDGENAAWEQVGENALEFQPSDRRTEILWEPGAEYKLPSLRVANKGNLALKYKLEFTSADGDIELADVLRVKVNNTTLDASLGDLLTGKADDEAITSGELMAGATSEEINISIKMKDDADIKYAGKKITGLKIKVFATQDTVEYDSYGNTYDANAEYYDLWDGTVAPAAYLAAVTDDENKIVNIDSAELLAAFAQSVNSGNEYLNYTVTLGANIDLQNTEWTPIGTKEKPFKGTFDGGNHTISNLKITSGSNVGLFGFITLSPANYIPGIKNLTLHNVTISANGSGAFVGNARQISNNAGRGGTLQLHNLKLSGKVMIEGNDVGGIIGTEWTDFQIGASNITVDVSEGSYVKGSGVIGGVFASTPHGNTVKNIRSNIDVIASGEDVAAGGIVGCAGWTLTDVTCTGDVVATGVAVSANGRYKIGKIVGKEANNPYWKESTNFDYYGSTNKNGSKFENFTANNTIKITLNDGAGTVLCDNGMTADDKRGSQNLIDYSQSMVGAPDFEWNW